MRHRPAYAGNGHGEYEEGDDLLAQGHAGWMLLAHRVLASLQPNAVHSMVAMLLYYITDRTQFSGDESARQAALLARVGEASRWGADYIQLREKDLCTRQLELL